MAKLLGKKKKAQGKNLHSDSLNVCCRNPNSEHKTDFSQKLYLICRTVEPHRALIRTVFFKKFSVLP